MVKSILILFLCLGNVLYSSAQNSMKIDFERTLRGESPKVDYQHREEATVVLNIEVNATGAIAKTDVDASKTTSLDYNLLNWCRKYVYRLHFEPSTDKTNNQNKKGTITLYFKP